MPQTPSGPGYHPTAPNIFEGEPFKLLSYMVDPTAAYENKPDRSSTLHTSIGLALDVLRESSDVFTPLKFVAGGLSAILKYHDVRCVYFVIYFIPLTLT